MKLQNQLLCFVVIFSSFICSKAAFGHARGENYIFFEFHSGFIDGRFEFSYDDLKEKIGVDIFQADGVASEEILKNTASLVHDYINQHFFIGPDAEEQYAIDFISTTLFEGEGGWAQYEFKINTEKTSEFLHITHEMCYENDRMHRGVLVIEEGDWPSEDYKMFVSMVFSKSNSTQILNIQDPPKAMTPVHMIWQGILHIWIGIDHILFLLVLVLPIVLIKENSNWIPASELSAPLRSLIKVVTVFTIAHSITLALASLGIVTLSSRLVESVIALSIILVGVNNITGRNHNISLAVILFLGLFHGLGFASVMSELPFRISEIKSFILIIIGFNLGVEIGQLAILIVIFQVLYALRKKSFYRPIVVKGGSVILIAIATYWFIERAFAL